MKSFDLRSVKLRSGEQHREEIELDLEPFVLGGQRYIPVPETIPAELVLSRASTGTVLELAFRAALYGPCYRCLADAQVDLPVAAREYQATSPGEIDELRTPYVREDQLDVGGWSRDALALALPEKILCRADCAGLCPTCGRDLNAEPHEHVEEHADPRWAALEALRDRL